MAYQMHEYIGGLIWLDADESHVTAAMARSEYEPHKLEAMQRLLKPGMTFVDVGANLGYFTLLAAKLVGPLGQVIAFEPHPENYRRLCQSIEANHSFNVLAYELAIGHPDKPRAPLYLGQQSGQHTLLPDVRPGGDAVDVAMCTLREALERAAVNHVNMVKVDVEGAEDLVIAFAGWQEMTSLTGLTLLLDLHPELGIHVRAVCRALRGLGFDAPENPDPNLHELICRREMGGFYRG